MALDSFFKKYWFGLTLIAIFSISAYFNLLHVINLQENDGKHINLSGKQRMLSQAIALEITKYYINGNLQQKDKGLKLIKEFEKNHIYLTNLKLSKELQEKYFGKDNLDKKINIYIKHAKNFFENWDETSYNFIIKNSDEILKNLNDAVTLFQKHSEKNGKKLTTTATIILLGTIVILLLETKYIFLPIQKENKAHEEKLKKLNNLLREKVEVKTQELTQLLEHVGQHIIISKVDKKGKLTYCSDAFCHKTKFEKEKVIGSLHPIFQNNKVEKKQVFSLNDGDILKTKIKNINIDGNIYWLNVKITPIQGVHHKVAGYLIICTDITEEMSVKEEKEFLEKTNKKLKTLASTCTLTNIYNRRVFEELLQKEIQLLEQNISRQTSLIFMDIDHFKQVNDTHGHLKGDEILVEFSKLMKKELRSSDIFARWGGEEFVMLLKDMSLKQATKKAENLRNKIASNPIAGISITCSFGVTELSANKTIKDIIKEADDMLYIAKQRGRNLVISEV